MKSLLNRHLTTAFELIFAKNVYLTLMTYSENNFFLLNKSINYRNMLYKGITKFQFKLLKFQIDFLSTCKSLITFNDVAIIILKVGMYVYR